MLRFGIVVYVCLLILLFPSSPFYNDKPGIPVSCNIFDDVAASGDNLGIYASSNGAEDDCVDCADCDDDCDVVDAWDGDGGNSGQ